MFELMRPQKKLVGKRIRAVKEELQVSFTELGDRLGLIKPTINSYVQGYTLAPLEVIQQLSKISGKSVGWFYFGEMEEYIEAYLIKKGFSLLLKDYPQIPEQLKKEYQDNTNPGWAWENEFDYPREESIDDVFAEMYHNIMKEYFEKIVTKYVKLHSTLEPKQQKELVIIISTGLYERFYQLGDIKYGDVDKIEEIIDCDFEDYVQRGNHAFDEAYLVGKLINIFNDDKQTMDFISNLSIFLTEQGAININFSGRKILDIFQSLRPKLIELYSETTYDEFYDWFNK